MKAHEIHVSEEHGHVLVFLPTPADCLKACDAFTEIVQKGKYKFKALCLPLHGRLSAEEQQQVFSTVSLDTRKIIFATNCAETSITVPGICYVVDTGMAKELQYDAKTRSNVLKLNIITKSSAEQRKGRAGRTQAGKCYRLFSKENFEEMLDEMKPEIMRVNLGQAMLKLMELGIENPCNFDFVESPPPSSFLSAMQNLLSLGAVENDKLTELGRKMAKFSLDPALSKLVIRGIDEKVGYEAIMMATLATMSGSIFFRLDENKENADLKKTEFCQEEGDFHTFLEVYKNYSPVPKGQKSQWCVRNFINGKAMKITSDCVRDLLQTCDQELGITVSTAYTSLPNVKEILQYLILEVFSLNICTFSGHRALGYIPLKGSEWVHVHPSSCLSYLGRITPQYLVYQTKLLTVKDYITGITPVSEDCLTRAIENGLYSNEAIEQLKECALITVPFGPYGVGILSEFCGSQGRKRHQLEEQIIKKTNDSALRIDTDFTSGLVTVYCKREVKSVVDKMVKEVLENIVLRVKIQSEVITLDDSPDNIRYVLNEGAVISDAVMPNEFVVFSVHDMEQSFEVGKLVKLCEESEHAYIYREVTRRQKQEILVSFKNAKAAMETAKNVGEALPCKVRPHMALQNKNLRRGVPFFQLFVTWNRRPLKGFGYMTFESVEDFYMYQPKLTSSQTLAVKEGHFLVHSNRKRVEELCLKNIPSDTKQEDVEKAIKKVTGNDVKFTLKLIREPEFETTDEQLNVMKNFLKELFSLYTHKEDIDVYIMKPKNNAFFWKAKVSFNNAKDGQIAYNAMNGYQMYPGTNSKLNMRVEINATIVCHTDVFEIAKPYVNEALEAFKSAKKSGDDLQIRADPSKDVTDFIVIGLQSNNIREMEQAHKVLQEIIQGDRIVCLGSPLLEKLFLPAGKSELKKIEKKQGSKIHLDFGKKTLSIIGSVSAQTQTKIAINTYLDLLDRQSNKEIHLAYPKKPQGFLKLMLQEYGTELSVLKDRFNLHSLELNLKRHMLVIFGSSESIQSAEDSLNELASRISTEADPETDEEACPVCLVPIPEGDNSYRLQTCGHPYCPECIQMQIQNCTIPMVCAAEECGHAFVIDDLKQLLDKKMKSSISHAALKHLVQTRNKEFRYCPTPECPAVYRVASSTSKNTKIFCDQCTNHICTKCNVQYHHGNSCEMYQNTKEDPDYYLKEWMKANPNDRKKCPACGESIEKNGGCMHMTCWSCKAHMCWRCMKVFSTGHQVYDHQSSCSGPIY